MVRTAIGPAALLVAILAAALALLPSTASAQADTTAPTVAAVAITSATADGTAITTPYRVGDRQSSARPQGSAGAYGIGDVIEATVTFSESVAVSGAPQLLLNVGSASRTAGYASAAGGSVVFNYTVTEGDLDANGLSISANRLSLNGGSIKDAANNNANLSHAALPDQENHKVDGIRPRIEEIDFTSQCARFDPASSNFCTAGESLSIDVEFTEPVYLSVAGQAQIPFDLGGAAKTAEWQNAWRLGDTEEAFQYLIRDGDADLDGPSFAANAVTLNGATLRDAAGNDAVLSHLAGAAPEYQVDAARPDVSSIAITSDPGDDDTYFIGDAIEVTVAFSENVTVPKVARSDVPSSDESRGLYRYPELELNLGGAAKTARFQSSAGKQVVFEYTVQAGDSDDDGVAIGADKLALNGGTILDHAGNNPVSGIQYVLDMPLDAVVPHSALADDAGHKVSGVASPLTLQGPATLAYQEDGKRTPDLSVLPHYRASGTDAAVVWSLSGDDGHLFRLRAREGAQELRFISLPDYENPADADRDNKYRVTIRASDGANTAALQVTVLVQNIAFDEGEIPVVVGTAHVGNLLTADTSRMTMSQVLLGPWYQWIRSDGTTDTEIPGARYQSYTLTGDDIGKTVKARVELVPSLSVDPLGWVSRTSEPTATVVAAPAEAAVNTPATGTPVISGAPAVGQTLTADVSGIADADGMTNATYSYQWIRNNGVADVEIAAGLQDSYALPESALGLTYKVRVSFIDDAGSRETLTSSPTAPVSSRLNNPATGGPAVSGTARVGETLTANISGIADADGMPGRNESWYAYRWLRSSDGGDAEVVGATESGYTLTGSDAGHAVKVRVSFNDLRGHRETLTSRATPVVAAIPPDVPTNVAVSSTEAAGELAVSWALPASDGGAAVTGYRVKWREYAGNWGRPEDVSEAAAMGTSHTITGLTGGVEYSVRVVAVNAAGVGPSNDDVTGTPASPPPAEQQQVDAVDLPGPVLNLQLSATADSVTVRWQAPESGDAPNRYIVHIKPDGGGKGAVKRPKARKTSVTFRDLEAGRTYQVWVRAQNEAGKGERTHASITLPETPPE